MKKWISLIGVLLVVLSCGVGVSASGMKIHVINLQENNGTTTQYGDAVLLESKGNFLLMDTGKAKTAASMIRYLKKVGASKLDIYISHMHEDHIGGINAILNNKYFHVGKIYFPDSSCFNKSSNSMSVLRNYKKKLEKKKVKIIYLKKGSSFNVGDAKINVLGPLSSTGYNSRNSGAYENNQSLCSMVTCGNGKYLTAGDISSDVEKKLVKKYGNKLRADILKLCHHGYDGSSSAKWLNTVKPKYVFVSNYKISSSVRRRLSKNIKLSVTGLLKCSFVYTINNNAIFYREVR